MRIIFVLLSISIFCFSEEVAWTQSGKTKIRVGVYQNHPKVFWEDQGNPQGIFIDILEEVARKENWELEYHRGLWKDNLDLLAQGRLDLLVDVTYSPERAVKYDFNTIPVLESWLQGYVVGQAYMERLQDLNGKRVAVLEKGIQETYLLELKKKRNINCQVLSYPDYQSSVKALKEGQVDILLANRFFYYSLWRTEEIHPTSLVLEPMPVYFAFAKAGDARLISAIDRRLMEMKNNPHSVYYRSLGRWLGEKPQRYIPAYLKWLIAGLASIIAILVLVWLVERQGRLERMSQKLESEVRERTAKLEELNRELQAFTYSVSHDLKVPLRAIDGFTNIFLEDYGDKLDAEGHRLLAVVRENVKRMAQMIEDLLDYARVGQRELLKETVDMVELIQGVIEELKTSDLGCRAEFVVNKLPLALGDRVLLRQVWLNLIGNAVKYSRERESPRVEIGFVERQGLGWYYVRDNGVGFDMRYADKLFNLFQRLHHQDRFPGTGVGLAIVQRIVYKHGGRVEAWAQPEQGAEFYFHLPEK